MILTNLLFPICSLSSAQCLLCVTSFNGMGVNALKSFAQQNQKPSHGMDGQIVHSLIYHTIFVLPQYTLVFVMAHSEMSGEPILVNSGTLPRLLHQNWPL